jgi:hypothetical protein
MTAVGFVSWEGGEDASLVRSTKGDAHRQREVVPSEVVFLSVFEDVALAGEEDFRNPNIRCTGMDGEGRDSTDEEGGELHGGQGKNMDYSRVFIGIVQVTAEGVVSEHPWPPKDSFVMNVVRVVATGAAPLIVKKK